MSEMPAAIEVVDSHTEGEPTRVVTAGWPAPRGATMVERRDDLRRSFDALRTAVVCEPRGHDALVGALLTAPVAEGSTAGVVFFNNVGYLGMCGHGLIGVVRTLEHLGRMTSGTVSLDTPAGTVSALLEEDGAVTITNVPSYCHRQDVEVDVPGVGRVTGDIVYGGNWFYLADLPQYPLEIANLDELLRATRAILRALAAHGITGAGGAAIDHVELSGPASRSDADAKNFVLCPGGAFDRSPCGTGTSAKMAALRARGKLGIGERWRQESITGSLFTGWLEMEAGELVPYIQGRAYVTGEATLRFDPEDPFRAGLSPMVW